MIFVLLVNLHFYGENINFSFPGQNVPAVITSKNPLMKNKAGYLTTLLVLLNADDPLSNK